MVHHFRDIAIFTVYMTTSDLEKSFKLYMTFSVMATYAF